MLELDKIYNMDCIEGMKQLDDNSIDLIVTDPPYGITQCKWDKKLALNILWSEIKRIIKSKKPIIFTASQPFTSKLVMSNIDWFKYEWIWCKNKASNFLNATWQPLKEHEEILVFASSGKPIYNVQLTNRIDKERNKYFYKKKFKTNPKHVGNCDRVKKYTNISKRYPSTILQIDVERNGHPTQKPLKLFEYLIKTYSNENNIVLDCFIGSGTTAVACKRLHRHFIGFEINKEYYDISLQRLLNVPGRLENWIDS